SDLAGDYQHPSEQVGAKLGELGEHLVGEDVLAAQVEQDGVERLTANHGEGLPAARGHLAVTVLGGQKNVENVSHRGVVLDDQHPAARLAGAQRGFSAGRLQL